MQLFLYIPAVLSILLIFSCAVRDNEYDPLSPLHKSPVISVKIDFDTTRSTSSNQQLDTISAIAPFKMDMNVSANDFIVSEKKAAVTFRHYLNDSLCEVVEYFSRKCDTLIEAGEHRLSFSAKSENKAETVSEIIVSIDEPTKPKITSFSCESDSLPLYLRKKVSFFVEFSDPDLIADQLVYGVTSQKPTHKITTISPAASFYDTCLIDSLYSFNEYTQTFWVYLYDKTGTVDSMSTTVTYSDDDKIAKRYVYGSAPIIDSIFIVEELSAIYASTDSYDGTTVRFSFAAQDPDGNIVETLWDFGDSTFATVARPTHQYADPGNYTVKLTVRDDSTNTTSDSITIKVLRRKIIPPKITTFTIDKSEGPAPLTINVSLDAKDEDGDLVKVAIYVDGILTYVPVWAPIQSQKIVLNKTGVHTIGAWAADNHFNITHDTLQVTVTEPKE